MDETHTAEKMYLDFRESRERVEINNCNDNNNHDDENEEKHRVD